MFSHSVQNALWKQNTEDHFSKYTLVKQCYFFGKVLYFVCFQLVLSY